MQKRKGIAYASAYLAIALTTQTVVTWYAYYYAPPDKRGYINIALVGIALLVGRIIDSLADPLVAYWSDNARYKEGRRIPFIKYGALPLVLSFVLIWFPLTEGESFLNFIYLSLVMSAFFFFFTVVVAPYLALLPELTPDPDERVTISTYQSIFNIIGLLLASVAAGILIDLYGFKIMGVILGIVSLLFFYLPLLTVQEKYHPEATSKISFFQSFGELLKNKNYLNYQIANLLLWFGINMLTITAPYIGGVLMGVSEKGSGFLLGGTFILAMLVSPLVLKLVHLWGKKKVFSYSILLLAFNLILLSFIGRPYLFFSQVWYGYLVIALAGIPISSVFIIPNAIIADLTDEDAAVHGRHREALFFGIQGLISKIVLGISSWVTLSLLFNYFGYTSNKPTGIYLTIFLAVLLTLIAYIVFKRGYNLSERDVRNLNLGG